MNHDEEDDAYLMSSEVEDDLVVVEEPEPSQPTTPSEPSTSQAHPIDTEINRILNTPWYELTADQAEVIHRIVELTSQVQLAPNDLRDRIEHSLMELAIIRGRNMQQLN